MGQVITSVQLAGTTLQLSDAIGGRLRLNLAEKSGLAGLAKICRSARLTRLSNSNDLIGHPIT